MSKTRNYFLYRLSNFPIAGRDGRPADGNVVQLPVSRGRGQKIEHSPRTCAAVWANQCEWETIEREREKKRERKRETKLKVYWNWIVFHACTTLVRPLPSYKTFFNPQPRRTCMCMCKKNQQQTILIGVNPYQPEFQ